MSDKPIDYKALEEMYAGLSKSTDRHGCQHANAISVDEYGVYHINCKQCGAFGATSEAGARTLGWIE